MALSLSHLSKTIKGEVTLTSSKSESNRALIIRAICDEDFKIENLSDSDDTKTLDLLLNCNEQILDVYHAGTVMRFLTAFCCLQKGERILTGSERMKQRPIKILVNALRKLGAKIEYIENDGFPPLKIVGTDLKGGKLLVDGSISSQYISALLMIAPKLREGLQIEFEGEITSKPYIDMTIKMMQHFGAKVEWLDGTILVAEGNYCTKSFKVEADWSAASYWYSMVALAEKAEIKLYGLKPESLQGDLTVSEIYKNFGVNTEFIENGVCLTKSSNYQLPTTNYQIDFTNCPDIAQTVAVTYSALNVKLKLTGLKTLRIKETDRISALQTELNKLGFNVEVDKDDLIILPSLRAKCNEARQSDSKKGEIASFFAMTNPKIKTYDDHRIAMAFAPLALIAPITIENPEVVKKSYPNFWNDLVRVGFEKKL